MLDLSSPARRNAIFSACTLTPEERAHYLEHMGDDDGPCVQFCRALSSPAESAAVVRALLEGCEVPVLGFQDRSSFPFASVTAIDGAVLVEVVHYPVPMQSADFALSPKDVTALILRLLDATTREEALAALREVGR